MAVVFVTGGTGFLGRALIGELLKRGHQVRALVRAGSEGKLPSGAEAVLGDALEGSSYRGGVAGCGVFVHLIGTPKPAPWKEKEFRRVDLGSAIQAGEVAKAAGVSRFVYVSVANPAPIMKKYIAIRKQAEAYLLSLGLNCTFLRPWYVLGPGRRWPLLLTPFYTIAKWVPAWREPAERLRLVSHREMVAGLVAAVEGSKSRLG
jgi:uncharacterized protein YbjT (DUF2867 family)